ncbi:CAP domain-containing protein [Strongyloides ratti]|uniref:CAP domain-containing protein n=1 Tax=Strongyloides ratti TaxID=34506 RepID=A0A090LEL0_STRRB|nr:CAP domain-containing protein [Strongyloides ratti]CEF66588.1 CAP domain-containing protein [Strongyloides ratti]
MDLKIFTIVLIHFALQSHENFLFSVPFNEHINSHSIRYEYRGKIFKNLKYLIRKASIDFPEVPYKNILLRKEIITHEFTANNILTNSIYFKAHRNGKTKHIIFPKNEIVIDFVPYHGRKYFICNRSYFGTYKEAKIYCEMLQEFDPFKYHQRLLGSDLFASRVWKSVWKDCYYKCFSQSHFMELRKRIFNELCMLRNINNVFPITYNKTLEFIAQHNALRNVNKNKLFVEGTESSGIHVVAAFSSPLLASLQVNKWYNLYLEEKNDNNRESKKESKQFHLLISPSISEVGIGVGVSMHRSKLSIVLTFK